MMVYMFDGTNAQRLPKEIMTERKDLKVSVYDDLSI